jgi:hypothetical protein
MKKEDFYARTMHTPDDPERAALRSALRDAWKQLLPLHRALIDNAAEEFKASGGSVGGPTHLLQLIQEDPFFTWLKPMTSLIVDLDEMSRKDFDRAQVDEIAARMETMFGTNADPRFAEHYIPVLQRDVDVAIGHAAIRQILKKLTPATK